MYETTNLVLNNPPKVPLFSIFNSTHFAFAESTHTITLISWTSNKIFWALVFFERADINGYLLGDVSFYIRQITRQFSQDILRAARGCQSPDRDSGNRKVGEKTIYVTYVK